MEKERRENESKTGRSGLAEDFVTSEELLEWTRAMVAIPSYSGRKDQEAGVGRYIKEIFDREGIECRIAPLKDGRCNVYARLPGKGGGRSLLLNGHMDTVPAYGMEKAYEPWTDENGFLHGRGTSDMKVTAGSHDGRSDRSEAERRHPGRRSDLLRCSRRRRRQSGNRTYVKRRHQGRRRHSRRSSGAGSHRDSPERTGVVPL